MKTNFSERTWLAVAAACCSIYPMWYLWPAIWSDSCRLVGSKPTDVGGAIQFAKIYSGQRVPWSREYLTNFPSGEIPLRWQEASQVSSRLILGLVAKLTDACSAINWFMALGWILTGIAAYFLARVLMVGHIPSVLGAVCVQLLPWWRTRIENHPTYLHFWMLLLLIAFTIRYTSERNRQNALKAIFVLFVCLTFDPYIAWFSLFICGAYFVSTAVGHNGLQRRKNLVRIVGVSALLVGIVTGGVLSLDALLNLGRTGYEGRAASVTTIGFLRTFSGGLSDWIRPDSGHLLFSANPARSPDFRVEYAHYMGGLGLLGAYCLLRRHFWTNGVHRRFLLSVTTLGILTTLQPVLQLGPLSFPNVTWFLRFVAIGIRHFSRMGLLSQSLLVIFAMLLIDRVAHRVYNEKRWILGTGLILVSAILIIDLLPRRMPLTFDLTDRLAPVAQEIQRQGQDSVLVLPMNGIAHVVQSYTNLRLGNSLFGSDSEKRIEDAASLSGEALAGEIGRLGIRHVLMARSDARQGSWNQYELLYELPPSSFRKILTVELPGAYYGEEVQYDLFEVIGYPAVICSPCQPGLMRTSFRLSGDVLAPEGSVRWSFGDELRVEIPQSRGRSGSYWVRVRLLSLVQDRQILLRTSRGRQLFTIKNNEATWEGIVRTNEVVGLQAVSPCPSPEDLKIAPDPRNLCFGILDVDAFPLERGASRKR